MSKYPKLTEKEAAEARERRRDFIANMAISGHCLTPEQTALLDKLDADRVGYEEGMEIILEWLDKWEAEKDKK